MKIYESYQVNTYHTLDLSKFKKIEYVQLKYLIEEHKLNGYYGFQGIEQKGEFAKIYSSNPHTPIIYILYESLKESKYVEYYLKRDFNKELRIVPVPDNYTGYIKKTSIAVSQICKDLLDELNKNNMSYEDVIYGLMAQLNYSDK